jgi:peptide chain release factor 3
LEAQRCFPILYSVTGTTIEHTESEVLKQAARRRTFAIISHPDAGKTTLTEKLLLSGGAIDLAGAVRGRKGQRHATSDWMAMEQERGISMTSSVLQFEHAGCVLNLLDTPGHEDFSEDTYRTLFAVDSAIMVLDAAKGIEPQTRKLFEVCRRRRIPLITFINKLDQPCRDPLGLLDEIEQTLAIRAAPINWPVGTGPDFAGLYDLGLKRFVSGDHVANEGDEGLDEKGHARFLGRVRSGIMDVFRQDLGLIVGLDLDRLDMERFRSGTQTPVLFGSALKDTGVRPLLEALVGLAPPPGTRTTTSGEVSPDSPEFSGLVFKIQANMDPRHRDRVAFVRICSGRFSRDMEVYNPRLDRTLRAARLHRFFAREREMVDQAFPGDIVGLINPGLIQLGDTLTGGSDFRFDPIPRFPPECAAYLRETDASRRKRLDRGLDQLEEEGVLQVFRLARNASPRPLVAVVGELQLDLVQSRLRTEYNVETERTRLEYRITRWLHGDPEAIAALELPATGSQLAYDRQGRPIVLFQSEWQLAHAVRDNSGVAFSTVPDERYASH